MYINAKNLSDVNSSIDIKYIHDEMQKCTKKYNQILEILENKNDTNSYLNMMSNIIYRNNERELYNNIEGGRKKKTIKKKTVKKTVKKTKKKTMKK